MRRFHTISEFHRFRHLPAPEHPLLSVFDVTAAGPLPADEPHTWSYDFYCLALKRIANPEVLKAKYGQQPYDFGAGVLSFVAPGQVVSFAAAPEEPPEEPLILSGWLLLIHPDFLWNTTLANLSRRYDFWSYAVHEALFLSDQEQAALEGLLRLIQQEYRARLDQFSKPIIVSYLETLLGYADRFYHRQFLTREKVSHQVLARLDQLLTAYFERDDLLTSGLPTPRYLAEALHLSPGYLRGLLKALTGQNTQQHIHHKLLEKAKEKLSNTELSVSEIAYQLGFEHAPSFSKLFKAKTNLSPLEFKHLFSSQ